MYSWMPTADRGRSSSTSGPYLLGLGIQTAKEEPVRPSAGSLILASLDGDPSCGAAVLLRWRHQSYGESVCHRWHPQLRNTHPEHPTCF